MTPEISQRPVIRYPGGKYRARRVLADLVPSDVHTVLSPFFGGGSFEMYLTGQGKQVYGADGFYVLSIFWKQLLHHPQQLAHSIQQYLGHVDFSTFKQYQAELVDCDEQAYTDYPHDVATKFFIVNRCSFSGATLSGGFSRESARSRFTQSSVDRIHHFNNPLLHMQHARFHNVLHTMSRDVDMVFLDPPYMLEDKSTLYGVSGNMHRTFDHQALRQCMDVIDKPFILTYNNTDSVRQMWSDYHITEASWAYGMNNSKQSSEVIIKNFVSTITQ